MKAYRRVILRCVFLCAPVFFLYNCTTLEEGFEFEAIPAISGLDCNKYRLTGFLTELQAAQGVVVKVPYQSSNGLYYPGEVVESDGVNGLAARLEALTFRTSPDSLTYIITGTPATAGTARFRLGAGRDSCDLNLLVGSRVGTVTNLGCGSPTVNGTLFAYVAAAGVTVTITYSGGNGGTYGSGEFSSTGVGGLKAVLTGGKLNQGAGSVNLTITGTPNGAGSANFPLVIAGSSCVLNLSVILPAASVTGINCSTYQLSGTVAAGIAVSGVSLRVPYSGGNGGAYGGQTIQSTGLTGLVATLSPGTLAQGNGELVFQLSGNLATTGSAVLLINIGGSTCNVILQVNLPGGCGVFIAPGVWKAFSCYNLGALNTSIDPFTPSWEIIGNYYQWGRNTIAASGPTSATVSNEGAPSIWSTIYAPNNSWRDDAKTSNDPCPAGFRVPTMAQWDKVKNNSLNPQSAVGTNWTNSATNYSTGRRFGPKLFLPAAGYRSYDTGTLFERGSYGGYWSSTYYTNGVALIMELNSGGDYEYEYANLIIGFSVRCVAE